MLSSRALLHQTNHHWCRRFDPPPEYWDFDVEAECTRPPTGWGQENSATHRYFHVLADPAAPSSPNVAEMNANGNICGQALGHAGDSRTDCFIEASVTGNYVEAYRMFGVCARVALTGLFYDRSFYSLVIYRDRLSLQYKAAKTWDPVTLASYSTTFYANTWYVLKLQCVGTNLKGFLNGVERISVTHTALTSGKCGIYDYLPQADAVTKWDNIKWEDYVLPIVPGVKAMSGGLYLVYPA